MVFKISYSMFLSFFAIPRHPQIPPRSSLLPTHSTFCPFSYRITRKTERKSTKRKSGVLLVWVSAWAGVCPRVWLIYPMSQCRGKPVLPRLAAIIFKQFLGSGGTMCSLPLLQAGILFGLSLLQALGMLSQSLSFCTATLLCLENAISLKSWTGLLGWPKLGCHGLARPFYDLPPWYPLASWQEAAHLAMKQTRLDGGLHSTNKQAIITFRSKLSDLQRRKVAKEEKNMEKMKMEKSLVIIPLLPSCYITPT